MDHNDPVLKFIILGFLGLMGVIVLGAMLKSTLSLTPEERASMKSGQDTGGSPYWLRVFMAIVMVGAAAFSGWALYTGW